MSVSRQPASCTCPHCKAINPALTWCLAMPMIDVYAPADLFPVGTDGLLGKELTMAVLRAEGVATPGPFHLNNTAAFLHSWSQVKFTPRQRTPPAPSASRSSRPPRR